MAKIEIPDIGKIKDPSDPKEIEYMFNRLREILEIIRQELQKLEDKCTE